MTHLASLLPVILVVWMTLVEESNESLVNVCTAYDMKNAVFDACNIYKRSMRLPAESPYSANMEERDRGEKEVVMGRGTRITNLGGGSQHYPDYLYPFPRRYRGQPKPEETESMPTYDRGTYDRDAYDGLRIYRGRSSPIFSRYKRSTKGNMTMDQMLHICCYDGCPLSWFIPICT